MPGVGATTYYDVVTRYKLIDEMSNSVGRIDRSVSKVDRSLAGLTRQTAMVGRGFRNVAMLAGPALGGMVGLAGAGLAMVKTFRNLNEEANSTIQLAAQVNLAFVFEGAQGAAENFNLAMTASRKEFRALVKDAAALPGELQDFINIAQQISGGVFAGGGDLTRMRELTARVALAAPAAGTGFQEAGLGAMQMLFGVSRVTNPLFKMLAGQGLVPKAEIYNALPATERLRRLDDALKRLTDNPMFRKNILGTWDTQIGTLSDNLFGIEGIFGQLLRGPFEGFIDWLMRLNEALDRNKDAIVRLLGGSAGGLTGRNLERFMGADVRSAGGGLLDMLGALAPTAEEIRKKQIETWVRANWGMALGTHDPVEYGKRIYALGAQRHAHFVKLQEADAEGKLRNVPKTKIEQNFHIKLDLKSDDAPEAVAVKITRAMEKVGRHPTTVSRGLGSVASMSGAGP